MRGSHRDSRSWPSLSGMILAIALAALPAVAQTTRSSTDGMSPPVAAQRPPRTDTPVQPRPDLARPARNAPPPVPAPEAPKARPLPSPDGPREPVRAPQPGPVAQPQPEAPRPTPPRPDLSRPQPDIAAPVRAEPPAPRQDGRVPPRPDLVRPAPETPPQPRPDASRVRRDIARPDRPRGPEPSVPANGPPPISVEIRTLAIVATNRDNRTDPALQNLAAQLRPTFRFSGYRLATSDVTTVMPGQPAVLRLVAPYALQVIPAQVDAQHVVLNVQALHGNRRLLGLQLRLRPGTYQLLGGWPVPDGTLLAAVSARTAP